MFKKVTVINTIIILFKYNECIVQKWPGVDHMYFKETRLLIYIDFSKDPG
jgi:hypothetical protein